MNKCPIIKSDEMLLVVPAHGEGYCARQIFNDASELFGLADDDTVYFMRFDVKEGRAEDITEEVAQAWLKKFDGVDPDVDSIPTFVTITNAWTDYLTSWMRGAA